MTIHTCGNKCLNENIDVHIFKTVRPRWQEWGRNSSRGVIKKCGSQRICPQIYHGIF
jgi:hypothetical protein